MRSAYFDFFKPIRVCLPSSDVLSDADDRLLAAWFHLSDEQLDALIARGGERSVDARAIRRRVRDLREARR